MSSGIQDPYPVIIDRDKVLAFIRDIGFESSSVRSFSVDKQKLTIEIFRANDEGNLFPVSDDEVASATVTIPLTGHCDDCGGKIDRQQGFCDACREKRQRRAAAGSAKWNHQIIEEDEAAMCLACVEGDRRAS